MVHRAPWEPVLLMDSILPTVPVPAGDSQSVEALRDRQYAVMRQSLPAAYHNVVAAQSLVFTLPTGERIVAPWPGPPVERRAPDGSLLVHAAFPSSDLARISAGRGVTVSARLAIRVAPQSPYQWQSRTGSAPPASWDFSRTPTEAAIIIPLLAAAGPPAGPDPAPALFDPSSGWALATALILK
ncbi:MAG TPA: hypothetical protein VFE31_09740 [Opitutaceae bacterium]|nr:hypothetical protein [Opitutaceae bacterium]